MKASYAWLRELVGTPDFPPPRALAARLTDGGLEVEAVHEYGEASSAVVVAEVLAVRPHPSSKHLRLVTVQAGTGAAGQEVVCGAPNVPEPGGLVVLAPLGAHLPAVSLTIAPRSIAGVTSEGMLCSEKELGLTDEEGGILVLPRGFAAPGTPLATAVPAARDTIFEIGLTPNRPDGLGHLGLAREVAALLGIDGWQAPPVAPPARVGSVTTASALRVAIEAPDRCPHYGAALVDSVILAPSPLAQRYRLAALGVRPISNVVDVTNYVMLEFGHPMHAFDRDKVRGGSIVVRVARAGETLRTLDGASHDLSSDDLLITDGGGPTALAGVMGGAESEISASTTSVIFECAYFDPRTVRRTARRHGIHTESSHRFERGVDGGDTRRALARAVELTAAQTGGAAAPDQVFVEATPLPARETRLRASRLASLLGVAVPLGEAAAILKRLGFVIAEGSSADVIGVAVPTHRPDVSREEDLIEEIARVRGLDAIPTVLPRVRPVRENANVRESVLAKGRQLGVDLGLSEALLYGFSSEAALAKAFAPAPTVFLKNPLAEHHAVMRTSLLPGLYDAASRAARHSVRDARLFAVGALFLPPRAGVDVAPSDAALPEERLAFAALLTGARSGWLTKPEPTDVWDAKAVAVSFVERWSGRPAEVRPYEEDTRPRDLHPRGAAEVLVEGTIAGRFGQVHPDVAAAFELDGPAYLVAIDLAALVLLGSRTPSFRPIPKFPSSPRDLAIVVPATLAAGDIARAVREAAGSLGEEVVLFDRYAGKGIPEGSVSLAFRVVYRANGRTLTDAEVDASHAAVVKTVEARFGAALRA